MAGSQASLGRRLHSHAESVASTQSSSTRDTELSSIDVATTEANRDVISFERHITGST